ncbi:DNA polymerase III subunit beta [Desulfuromonas acetoxidans]|uniref:Beta sliding clamp n=1 Tax=Desulfuromonas acetoxidans (strain DSM 684 / 11070) TaxID=281689 RepID=Q1JZF2_DESA6|nr:DNA polymerase III subunit beta [Desulfuromonas acetoxidans]EAT15615.1 DNA polymerase III, beta subunit [Desulfuromonas acetoxidans DSM 684]MBF0645758.1 DNA polymerase III subunit beta [Desulfuromonas acetoxidans]NVD25208.1 DNA polymerase III subunit beta [Desulfuromonas acetoxidans]NVE17170.1 DNA polymerase III subunit beta [Desulfuromonas acetoxidans]
MKITTKKNDLLKGLTLVQGVVEKKKTLPILSNVLLETDKETSQLILTATDLEIGIKTHIKAEIISDGKITISAKKLYEIVKELADAEITLKVKENNWVEIINGKAKFNIVGLSSEEFPLITDKQTDNNLSIDGITLKNIIDKTFYAISNDESKFNLNGIYLHSESIDNKNYIKFVSTDGHRLSLMQIESDTKILDQKGVIFPKKGLAELRKIIDQENQDIKISILDNNAVINIKETTLVMRLIDGDFPDYKRVIPEMSDNYCQINGEILLHTLRRISLLANEKSKGINIEFLQNEINVTSSNPEYGDASETIKTIYEGNNVKIGFNSKYLIDVISNVVDKDIRIYIKDNMSPCLILPEDTNNYLAVIMPMRI